MPANWDGLVLSQKCSCQDPLLLDVIPDIFEGPAFVAVHASNYLVRYQLAPKDCVGVR